MPVFLAGAIAWSQGYFEPLYFVIALIAAAAIQIGLTMFNDVLDFVYGTDTRRTHAKNPFCGGSGVLTSGIIRPKQALIAVVSLYAFGLAGAIYLALTVDIRAIWIAVLGGLISIFYSAKPFRFAYRGLGEFMMFLGYGPILTAWAYFVISGGLNTDILLVGAIPGLLMWTMILINEVPDYAEDRAADKKNIVYHLGCRQTKNLFVASLIAVYVYILVLLVTGVLPPMASLVFLGIPLAVQAARAAHRYYLDPFKMGTANRSMVYIYSATIAALAIGYLI
jgi:1,4-dihydroxy-2-naphthoate octaprenyltransferase